MGNVYHLPTRPGDEPGTELVGPVYEGELVDERLPVDQPALPAVYEPVWQRQASRSPVVPVWVADRDTRRAAARWAVGSAWHTTRYHALRTPVYAVRLAGASPRGAVRTLSGAVRWVADQDTRDLVRTAGGSDARAAARLAEIQVARSRSRAIRLGLAAFTTVLGWVLLGHVGPDWAQLVALVAVVAGLGVVGRRKDKPIITHAVSVAKAPRLTADSIVRALGSIGIPDLRKPEDIGFPASIARDGKGFRADVDLPLGVTAGDVMDRRDRLASGLRRPMGCVWPEPAPEEHPGRLVLWVGDQDMARAKQPPWPLAKSGQADLFRPVPFAFDQRGRLIELLLMFASMLIGAMPRMGKTRALRLILLAAALDPVVQIRIFELKGTGDLGPLEPVAHHYGSGPDDATLENCMASLREVYGMLETRAATIRSLSKAVCPESKVSPQLAARRNLELYPVGFAIDECQELFSHPDYAAEAERLCLGIIKRGPALGIMLWLATQRPDAKSLPTGISANVDMRFCLRVMGQIENDMVLGTSRYKQGYRATMFTKRDKGIGWLIGDGDEPQVVRTADIDGPQAERIVARARALREAAGTLTGYAVGQQEFAAGPDRTVVDDMLQVVGANEEAVHLDVACGRLAEEWPGRYRGWGATQLRGALTSAGLPRQRNVWAERPDGGKDNRAGVTRAALLAAARGES